MPEPNKPTSSQDESPSDSGDHDVIPDEKQRLNPEQDDSEKKELAEDELTPAALNEDGSQHRRFQVKRIEKSRLDVYLQGRLKGISRSRIQNLIDIGGVKVNDTKPKPSTKISRGDVLDVTLPAQRIRRITPEDIPLDILHEDNDFLAINKQADLVVHPARSQLTGTLLHAVAFHFKKQAEAKGHTFDGWETKGFAPAGDPRHAKRKWKEQRKKQEKNQAEGHVQGHVEGKGEFKGQTIDGNVEGLSSIGVELLRPGIVHRLDRFTTGVMVVAKSDAGHWGIAKQFEQRVPTKAYLALVHGGPDLADGPGGVIDQPIGKHPTVREAFAVRHDSQSRESVTIYRVRERYRGYTLLELELKTGRTHQIRVHLQYMGWPIVGDLVYGGDPLGTKELSEPTNPPGARRFQTFARTRDEGLTLIARSEERKDLLLMHPALHAAYLKIKHPSTDNWIDFVAPLHEPMKSLIRDLRTRPKAGPVATEGYHVDLSQLIPEDD